MTKPAPHKFTVTVRGPRLRAVAKNRLMLAFARRQPDGCEFNVSNPRTKLSRKQVAEFLRNEMAGAGTSYVAPFYAIVIQYLEEAK